jgi:flavin-dependent dehydrogenase
MRKQRFKRVHHDKKPDMRKTRTLPGRDNRHLNEPGSGLMSEPVTIVGAGPAGLTAAIVLRKHGVPVKVYERFPDVGYRLNGDYQGLENWSTEQDVTELLKDMGIEINFLCVPYYEGTVHTPQLKQAWVTSKRPLFYLVKRGSTPGTLDVALKEQAESLGVEFVFNHRVIDFRKTNIVGTGPRSADAIAVGMTFTTSLPDTAAGVFDNNIASKGYAYLLVHGGFGTLATLLYSDFSRQSEYFDRTVNFFKGQYGLDIRNEKRFVSYGNFFLRDTRMWPNSLYVGESAGFQDYLWGFGMRYAFLSGFLAARSIMDDTDYEVLWQKQLKPMLETSIVNRFLIETFGHIGYRYLARKLVAGDPCRFLRHHYNYSSLKHLLLPFAKMKFGSRAKIHSMQTDPK